MKLQDIMGKSIADKTKKDIEKEELAEIQAVDRAFPSYINEFDVAQENEPINPFEFEFDSDIVAVNLLLPQAKPKQV